MKLIFNRAMDWLGRLSPQLSYSIRTILGEAAFPFRPAYEETAPNLREDLTLYADLYRKASENFLKIVPPYRTEVEWPRARVFNGFFQTIDAELYYCIVRFFRPKRIVEVGAGYSTWFARDALKANGGGQLYAIDPAPRLLLPKECQHQKTLVQHVELGLFQELQENDILFIDSSHTREEAMYHVEQIYPILRPGVLIHHHDILFPFLGFTSLEPDWEDLGEQDVVLEFLKHHPESYEVITSSAFVQHESPGLVLRLIPSKVFAPRRTGGSIWIRKKARFYSCPLHF